MKKTPAIVAILTISACVLLGFARMDTPFFNQASQANLAEIQAGQLAITKGSPYVQKLGKQMVEDHTTAENELKAIASKQNISIALSPDTEHKQVLDSLSKLSGKAFDSAYLKSQLADHQVAVTLFSGEATTGIDPVSKAYAAKYLPKLKMHLQMFQGKSVM